MRLQQMLLMVLLSLLLPLFVAFLTWLKIVSSINCYCRFAFHKAKANARRALN